MTYRACYWTDGQSDVVLTTPDQAHLPDDELKTAAMFEAVRAGMLDEGRMDPWELLRGLRVGEWVS